MKKFTLLELLVVIAIIGILLSFLLPSITLSRYKAMQTVCLSNLKQAGTAMLMYMKDNSMYEHHLYYNYTGDHPFEGTASRQGKQGPGNPAMWTLNYFSSAQEKVYTCPLVSHDQQYTIYPEDSGGVWGDYLYFYGKASKTDDPWKKKRDKYSLHTSLLNANPVSEGAVLVDYPVLKAVNTFSEWRMAYTHYNALMKDNSAKTATYKDLAFYQWLFGNTKWGG